VLKKTIVDISCVEFFYYKFSIITKINLFKGYTITIHVDEADLRCAIH